MSRTINISARFFGSFSAIGRDSRAAGIVRDVMHQVHLAVGPALKRLAWYLAANAQPAQEACRLALVEPVCSTTRVTPPVRGTWSRSWLVG